MNLTPDEQRCMAEAFAVMEENPELVAVMAILPDRWLPLVRQALVVAYWIGAVRAREERLEAIERMGH